MLRLERLEACTLVPVLAHAKPSVANLQSLDMERSLERQYAPILGSKFPNTWYKRSLLLYTKTRLSANYRQLGDIGDRNSEISLMHPSSLSSDHYPAFSSIL